MLFADPQGELDLSYGIPLSLRGRTSPARNQRSPLGLSSYGSRSTPGPALCCREPSRTTARRRASVRKFGVRLCPSSNCACGGTATSSRKRHSRREQQVRNRSLPALHTAPWTRRDLLRGAGVTMLGALSGCAAPNIPTYPSDDTLMPEIDVAPVTGNVTSDPYCGNTQ